MKNFKSKTNVLSLNTVSGKNFSADLSDGAKNSSLIVLLLAAFVGLVVTLSSHSAYPAGGDLGGGGGKLTALEKEFRVDQERLQFLAEQKEITAARQAWLQTLSEKENEELLNKVFKNFIAPQVQSALIKK